MSYLEILRRLVAFPTVSEDTNRPLLDWVAELLAPLQPRVRLFPSPDSTKANMLVGFGPDVPGGLVLSGHTDVVPVAGQAWTADPWTLREADGRLVGRGTCDMKGFVACCLALAPSLAGRALRRPVHLALSYDEEVGCTGVGPMAEWVGARLAPSLAVIGEPSELRLVTAHKGGLIGWGHVGGTPGHSSQPDRCVNAVMVAADCIGRFNALRTALRSGPANPAFDPPWSTVQVNRIEGGEGLNIVASACRFFWEMRLLPGVRDRATLAEVETAIASEIVPAMHAVAPESFVRFDVAARIPALVPCAPALEARLLALLGQTAAVAVPYGSEAGLFQEAGTPAIILGPGSIAQAHQPDEWIARDQLDGCMAVLDGLVNAFCADA